MSKLTQHQKILKMLKEAGSRGVPNYKFAHNYILSYPKRLSELRFEGHNIIKERQIVHGKSTGVFIYTLIEEKPKKKFNIFRRGK